MNYRNDFDAMLGAEYGIAIAHHGVKGMKWGIRRYQNKDGTLTPAGKKKRQKTIDAINSMYDHSNKWTSRKADKLERKGKTAKAAVMRELVNQNEKDRKRKVGAVRKMNISQLNRSKSRDRNGVIWLDPLIKDPRTADMTSKLSRLNEYGRQRSLRWKSNTTFEQTMRDHRTPKQGLEYLGMKVRNDYLTSARLNAYNAGYRSKRR